MKSYGSLCSVTRRMKLWCAKRILRTGITGGSHDLREVTDRITDQVSEGNSSRGDKPAYSKRRDIVSGSMSLSKNAPESKGIRCIVLSYNASSSNPKKTRTLDRNRTDPIWPSFDHWTLERGSFLVLCNTVHTCSCSLATNE